MERPVGRTAIGTIALVIGGTALAFWIVVLVIGGTALAFWLNAQLSLADSGMGRIDLAPDVLVNGKVNTEAESSVEYVVDVPAEAFALEIEAICADADVDLACAPQGARPHPRCQGSRRLSTKRWRRVPGGRSFLTGPG